MGCYEARHCGAINAAFNGGPRGLEGGKYSGNGFLVAGVWHAFTPSLEAIVPEGHDNHVGGRLAAAGNGEAASNRPAFGGGGHSHGITP